MIIAAPGALNRRYRQGPSKGKWISKNSCYLGGSRKIKTYYEKTGTNINPV
jgi:hypothetical protein